MKNQAIKTTGKYALYATLTVVTVGQIVTATTALELGVAGLDMLALGTDIYIDYKYDELNSTPQGKKYLEYWHIASLIYGGTRIYAEFSGVLKDLNTAQKSLSTADRLKVEVSSLKLYKGFFINKFPNIVSKLQTYDNATQLRFFDDFLGAEESILTKLNTETNRIDLWKSFENEAFLAKDGSMRGRYIRDLGIVPSENIAVLQDIISWRKSIIKTLNNNGLDINLGEFTTKTNISFTEIQYKINGIEQEPLKLLGISGVEPSNQLLAKTDGIIDGFKVTSSPPAKNSDRFFDAFAPFNKDSEGRTIEEAMFIIGR
jgi:hypothetical protein